MSKHKSRKMIRNQLSRRTFLGVTGGGALASLMGLPPTPAAAHPDLLRDYTGRLCYNENPLGPSPLALAAMSASLPMGHRYGDWFSESLREDLAELHGVTRSETIAGCGATEILRLAARAFASPDGNVVCPYPSYGQFGSDAGYVGSEVRNVDLDPDYRIDLTAMAAQVDENTTAVCITNPNNPTATVLSATAISDFVDALPAGVVTLIDEAYHEYVQDPNYASAMELVLQKKDVVVIRTFSKVHGLAGIRIGYAVGQTGRIGPMANHHLYATVSRPSLAGAQAALEDAQHIADTVALALETKAYCFGELDRMSLPYIPSETNFFMVAVGEAGTVASELATRGIQVRTGWGMPNHIRVSTGTMEEMQAFIIALEEILSPQGAAERRAPKVTALEGNLPNPFRTRTEITCALAAAGMAELHIYDIHGRLIRTLMQGRQSAGRKRLIWDGTDGEDHRVAAGSYFYRLTAGDHVETRRMIVGD